MRPLQDRLAPHYSTLCVDWPGFGDGARPQIDWRPDTYSAFLSFLLAAVMPQPHAVIAAGHAAAYALKHATNAPQAKLVLLAPTWRGPLPTVAAAPPVLRPALPAVDLPGLGPLIYRLNVNRFVVQRMAAGHV
jgi:pimeloyl-ACP methyl ester carboxylesterase